MPLPTDEKLLALSQDLLTQFESMFGAHPGFRPAHAKGVMLQGTFTPTPAAATLSRATHFTQPSTPVLVRFSNSTGLPQLPDNDPNADPRGLAIRFVLGDHVHTDIVSHSVDGFPTRTGAEFLEFLRAATSGDSAKLDAFFQAHPAALQFVQTPKPAPSSFARETYFGVTAMRFTNAAGESRYGRYRILPEEGNDFIDAEALKTRDANFLFDEILSRISTKPARFKLYVQIAKESDYADDATIHWPEDRELLDVGTLELTAPIENDAAEQKQIIFDPIPRLDGIEPSDDPLLELRAAVYLISGRRRRSA